MLLDKARAPMVLYIVCFTVTLIGFLFDYLINLIFAAAAPSMWASSPYGKLCVYIFKIYFKYKFTSWDFPYTNSAVTSVTEGPLSETPVALGLTEPLTLVKKLTTKKYFFIAKKTAFLISGVANSSNTYGVTTAVLSYIDSMVDKYGLPDNTYEAILPYFKKLFLLPRFQSNINNTYFSAWKDLIGDTNKILDSEAYRMLRRIVLFLITLPFIPTTMASNFIANYSSYELKTFKKTSTPNLALDIINSLNFFLESGYQYFMGDKSLRSFIHTGPAYGAWFDQSHEVINSSSRIGTVFEQSVMNAITLDKVKTLISEGKMIASEAALVKDSNLSFIKRITTELALVEAKIENRIKLSKSRNAPFTISIEGPPKAGKSNVVDLTTRAFSSVSGIDMHTLAGLTHFRSGNDKFWTGFNTNTQLLVMDDVAAMDPNGSPDESMKDILNMLSTMPHATPQAAIELKGKVMFNANVVILTTNTKDLNSKFLMNAPAALFRRIQLCLEVRAKTQFSLNPLQPGLLQSLDSNKIAAWQTAHPNEIGEYSEYRCYRTEITTNDRRREIDLHPTVWCNRADMYRIIRSQMLTHNREQEQYASNTNTMVNSPDCNCEQPVPRLICPICSLLEPSSAAFIGPLEEPTVGEPLELKPQKSTFITDNIVEPLTTVSSKSRALICQLGTFVSTDKSVRSGLKEFLVSATAITAILAYLRIAIAVTYATRTKHNSVQSSQGDDVSSVLTKIPEKVETVRDILKLPVTYALPKEKISLKEKIVGKNGNVYTTYKYNSAMAQHIGGTKHSSHLAESLERDMVCISHPKFGGTTLLPYKGHDYVLNKHFIVYGCTANFEHEIFMLHNEKIGLKMPVSLSCKDFHWQDNKADVCTVVLRCLPATLDYSPYYATHDDFTRFTGAKAKVVVINNATFDQEPPDEVNNQQIFDVKIIDTKHKQEAATGLWRTVELPNLLCYTGHYYNGDCGSPLVVSLGNKSMILSMHVFGYNGAHSLGMGVPLTRSLIESTIVNKPEATAFVQMMSGIGDYEKYSPILAPLHKNSFARSFKYNVRIMGTIPNYKRGNLKSDVQKTILHESILLNSKRVLREYYQPILHRQLRLDGSFADPYINGFAHCMKPASKFNGNTTRLCMFAWIQHVQESKPKLFEGIKPLNLHEALNGVEGDPYINAMDWSTSAGYPFNTSKTNLTEACLDTRTNQPYKRLLFEVAKKVGDYEAVYLKGGLNTPVFNACLKSEPVKEAKVDHTRVFCSAPFALNILLRKYFLPIMSVIRKNPLLFCTAVGINPRSKEWASFSEFLMGFNGDTMIAGDYKAYDKTMTGDMILWAFELLIRFAQKTNAYTHYDIKIMRGLAHDVAFPLINVNGDVIATHGGNPSGHSLTVDINCIVNVFYLMAAWMHVGYCPRNFFEDVHLLTYGDDNVMGVSDGRSLFNHTTISQFFASKNLTYTMADKTSASVPYISINEVSFLKRTFTRHDEWDQYIENCATNIVWAPLEKDSIYKSLQYRTKISNSEYEHAIEVVNNARIEAFAHGPDFFNEIMELTDKALDDNHIDIDMKNRLRFENVVDYYPILHE